jgi:UDP-glucose 4-epimerase
LTAALLDSGAPVTTYTRERSFWRTAGLAPAVRAADIVFYLASSVNPAVAEQHPEWVAADHHQFRALLRALARLGSPPTIVLASSGGTVYDSSSPPPYTEESPVRGSSLYAAAKIALEDELSSVAAAVPGVILRLSNVYGPGQRTGKGQGVLAYWLEAAARGSALRLIGDPGNTHDYVYIDDVVAGMCLIHGAVRRQPGLLSSGPLILNIGSGRGTSLAELIKIVDAVVGRDMPVERHAAPRISRPHVWLDCGQAERVLGWRPVTSLTGGVSAMWQEIAGHVARPAGSTAAR